MKWIRRALIAIFAVPLGVLLVWYVVGFLPYVDDMAEISESGKRSVASVEERAFKIATIAESPEGMRSLLVRHAYRTFALKGEHPKNLYWHLNTAFWYFASFVHFNDKEIFYFWSETVWLGRNGVGLSAAAEKYFKKSLSQLSDLELVSLIAMARSPSRYRLGRETLNARVNNILGQAAHNN